MNFYILLGAIIISFFGMFFLLNRKIKEIISLSEDELIFRVRELRSVSHSLHDEIIVPLSEYWRSIILPKIYKGFEKMISRIRISILKIEHSLLRLTNYIRGKREVHCNDSTSEYWEEINGVKNGNSHNGKKDNKDKKVL